MKVSLLVVICLMLVSCATATSEKYDKLLNSWLNKPEVALLSSWGAPDSIYEVEDKKFIAFYRQYSISVPTTIYAGRWSSAYTFYQTISQVCKTTFTVEQQHIVAWSHQ